MILYILIGVIILDCFFSLYRIYRRINLYNQAYEKSKSSNKELLVIGNPYSGFINKNIYQCYDCGDICLDLNGCGDCPKQIKGDLLEELKKMESKKYVIFESCVLEYINDNSLSEIKIELDRVSGGDLYQVRNSPYIFPLHYKFIENG
tara:strand:- start:9735 stop:10178 length:444 start_codon:yes stop_codon:yes gene_type:complete